MPAARTWDPEATVDLTGAETETVLRDDPPQVEPAEDAEAEQPAEPGELAQSAEPGEAAEADDTDPPPEAEDAGTQVEAARELSHDHLAGLIEALVFASDKPVKAGELARLASAPVKQVREVLAELRPTYAGRGFMLDEVAGGWLFRTSAQYAPFVRELASERPVRLTRAQVETLAIVAYRQPITRPEIDDIRGVDSGATLKLLLERELVRILGKKDEPGRPILYGTTNGFLELFSLKSLKDLPTLKEFTELNEESRRVAEAELGDVLPPTPGEQPKEPGEPASAVGEADGDFATPEAHEEGPRDTVAPPAPSTDTELEDPP
jgi:segregation and condensation protein B